MISNIFATYKSFFNETVPFDQIQPVHWNLMVLFHDQGTMHAEKGCVEMSDFHMVAFMFLTGYGRKARTHAHEEIRHFPTRCIIQIWKALGLWTNASQTLVMHLIGKCATSTLVWVLAIIPLQKPPLSALIRVVHKFHCTAINVRYRRSPHDKPTFLRPLISDDPQENTM